jgi:hypothetical protein
MALFIDGSISGLQDLIAQDSQLLDVATVEGIDVTLKMASAQEEIGLDLVTLLNSLHFVDQPFWLGPQTSLNSVVVTTGLKLWHIYRTLEMVYSDAYSSQLIDRYGAKRGYFRDEAKRSRERLIQIGIGVTSHPVPRAATPKVIAIPGSLSDGIYYVTMAWVNLAGEEGASAVPAVITLAASTLQVNSAAPPPTAVSWNVYVGHAPEAMVIQNGSPIPAWETWLQAAALAASGQRPGSGQEPNYLKPIPRVLQRG